MRFKLKLWMLAVALIVAAIAIIVIRMPTVKTAPAQPTTAIANPHVVYCRHGVLSDDKAACCPSDCPECGGAGCTSERPHCCVQPLNNAKAYCLDSLAVRCLLPPGAATAG